MKLLGGTKNKIIKDKKCENIPHLEITAVVLDQCNIVNNNYQQDSRVLYIFVPNKSLGQLFEIFQKMLHSSRPLIQSFHILKYGLQIKILDR